VEAAPVISELPVIRLVLRRAEHEEGSIALHQGCRQRFNSPE